MRYVGHRAASAAWCGMCDALESFTENIPITGLAQASPKPPIFWPSGIPYIDINCGGFYGLAVVAAEKGTGKTMLSLSSAMRAAAAGEWQVVYYAAEDDDDGLAERIQNYLEANPNDVCALDNFYLVSVGKGQTPTTLTNQIHDLVDLDSNRPILTCLDSINTICNLNGDTNYLQLLRDFGLWAAISRRLSGGKAAFLINSETNKRGEVKGETLAFWADVYVKLKKETDIVVSMFLDKTRRTKGAGPMGKSYRSWAQQEFQSEHSRHLRAVND